VALADGASSEEGMAEPRSGRPAGRPKNRRSTLRRAMARGLAVAACLLALPLQASTNGVRVGNGRLHPSLDLEGRYDSLAGVAFGTDEVVGDFILRVRPGISLEVPSPTALVRLDAKADYNRYLGLDVAGTRSLSYLGGDAHLAFHVSPDARVSLKLGDRFSHSDRTSAVGLGVGVLSLFNEAYVQLPIRPGGGALSVQPGYAFAFEGFLSSRTVTPLSADAHRLSYLSHRPHLEAHWRFLPKTAVVLDVRGDIRRYPDADFNIATNALYSLLGVSGLVTPKVALVARGGYGNTFLPTEVREAGIPNYESFIGQLEATWILSETARFNLGVSRSFFPVPRFGWYGDHRVYGQAQLLFAGRLLVEVDGAYHFLNYATGRRDALATPGFTVGYRITPWMNFGLGYRFSLRASSAPATQLPAATHYLRHETFGVLVLTY
jgi:hypothetical protein